jgi:hypothetical protein
MNKKKSKNNRDFLKAPEPSEPSKFKRGGSLNLGRESKKYRDKFSKRSVRATSAERRSEKTTDSDKEDDIILRSNRTPVRWHSFQNPETRVESINIRISTTKKEFSEGMSMNAMSCGQLQVIRKLALVTLTGYMERYCPSHRTGWNWELPKFIRKIKAPDYKGIFTFFVLSFVYYNEFDYFCNEFDNFCNEIDFF